MARSSRPSTWASLPHKPGLGCLPPSHPTLANEGQLVTPTILHGSGWAVSVPSGRHLDAGKDAVVVWVALGHSFEGEAMRRCPGSGAGPKRELPLGILG